MSHSLNALTKRERETLKLFAQGLSYQEIGELRSISAFTAHNATSGIQKLRLDSLGRSIASAERVIAQIAGRGRWNLVH